MALVGWILFADGTQLTLPRHGKIERALRDARRGRLEMATDSRVLPFKAIRNHERSRHMDQSPLIPSYSRRYLQLVICAFHQVDSLTQRVPRSTISLESFGSRATIYFIRVLRKPRRGTSYWHLASVVSNRRSDQFDLARSRMLHEGEDKSLLSIN